MRKVASGSPVHSLRQLAISGFLLTAAAISIAPAYATASCPGNPDAIGTSRTIVVDPREHPLIGTMQYRETLPLEDYEVVLTFDDGPIPKYSNQVLKTLAEHCAKATFFIVGSMARGNPEGVRKLIDAGHTVGTHTQNHPLNMHRTPMPNAQKEIEDGIASVQAAMKDPQQIAPFFRIPGLLRANGVEAYAAERGLQIWSADFPADDWLRISAEDVRRIAVQRIEARKKGIILLHDIQARTATALPFILSDLKARGYRIVHVVAATADRPATPTTPRQWRGRGGDAPVVSMRWPRVPNFVYAETEDLPAPSIAISKNVIASLQSYDPYTRVTHGTTPLRGAAVWGIPADARPDDFAAVLPAPAMNLFQIAERTTKPIKVMSPSQRRNSSAKDTDGIADILSREKLSTRGSSSNDARNVN